MKTFLNYVQQKATTPATIYLSAVMSGIVGIALLLIFFGTFLSASHLLLCLPAIAAFNGAGAAYGVREKLGIDFPYGRRVCLSIAAIMTITSFLSFALLFPWELSMDTEWHLWLPVLCLPTIVSTFFGFWLARKNHQLSSTSNHLTQ